MKTSKGFELPPGWEPIETIPFYKEVNLLLSNGKIWHNIYHNTQQVQCTDAIGWQNITPLKKVERYVAVGSRAYWHVIDNSVQTGVAVFYLDHPSPEAAAKAEAKRLNEMEGV